MYLQICQEEGSNIIEKLRGIKSYYILPIFYIWEKFGLFCSSVYLHKIIDFVVWIKKKVL